MSDVIFEPIAKELSAAPHGLEEEVADSSIRDPPPDPPAKKVVAESQAPKKPRGRPKGSTNKPKAPPPKEPEPAPQPPPPQAKTKTAPKAKAPRAKIAPPISEEDSSSEEEREIRHTLTSDDLETSILQFLTNRRFEQQTKRKDLWANLARSGLR